ncbi:MAG TPA: hypothetical protein VGY55_20170 [Pirellulales bacterium]|nr:hypothetical protein [Pirellulales bacterium]
MQPLIPIALGNTGLSENRLRRRGQSPFVPDHLAIVPARQKETVPDGFRSRRSRQPCRLIILFVSPLVWVALPGMARLSAAEIYWNVAGPADWNTAANWTPPTRVPGANNNSVDDANLENGGIANITASPPAISGIALGGNDSASVTTTVNQSAGTLTVNNLLVVGLVSGGGPGIYNQSGGSVNNGALVNNVASGGLWVGQDSISSGTYSLSGGTLNASIYGNDSYVGVYGNGILTQTGNSVANFQSSAADGSELFIGYQAGSIGTYNLANTATLHAYHQEEIGYLGTGTFTQTGGTHIVDQALTIGDQAGSSGAYNMQGGTLDANSSLFIGFEGAGTFTQTGGMVNVADDLDIQLDQGAGTYNLKGGTLSVVGGGTQIFSAGGKGVFNFTGGTLKVLAYSMGGNLAQSGSDSASTLDVTGNDTTIYAGYDINGGTKGAALMVGNGHALTVLDELSVEGGTVTITQTSGTIGTGLNFDIANGTANGTFNLSGGSVSFGSGGFNVANQGGTGVLNLSGSGTINASMSNDFYVANGAGAMGTVNQTGGTLHVRSGGRLNLTNAASASGIFNLKGGTLDAGAATIANGPGNGVLVFTGGTLRVGTIAADMFDVTQDATSGPSTLDVTASSTTINVNYSAAVSSAGNTATVNVGAGRILTMATGKSLLFGNQSQLFGSGTIAIGPSGNLVYGSNLDSTFAGAVVNSGNLIKTTSSTLEIDGAPTLNSGSTIQVTGGRLRFNVTSGAATIASGVKATISSGATLELAGSVSALSSSIAAADRVDITNSSTAVAGGLLVSGMHQQAGGIDGSGNVVANAGSDLTANHIVQNALIIGGTSTSSARVTIAASSASGNPLDETAAAHSAESTSLTLASSLLPSEPFGSGPVISPTELADELFDRNAHSGAAMANGSESAAAGSAVPEPSALMLAAIAGAFVSWLSVSREIKKARGVCRGL